MIDINSCSGSSVAGILLCVRYTFPLGFTQKSIILQQQILVFIHKFGWYLTYVSGKNFGNVIGKLYIDVGGHSYRNLEIIQIKIRCTRRSIICNSMNH